MQQNEVPGIEPEPGERPLPSATDGILRNDRQAVTPGGRYAGDKSKHVSLLPAYTITF